MIRTRWLAAVAAAATLGTAGASAQPPPSRSRAARAAPRATRPAPQRQEAAKEPVPIVVNTAVDRPAVWIGDPVVYTIEITCPPGSDILAADISRERLKLTGLEVAGAAQQRDVRTDGTIVYRAEFRLVSFVTDGSKVGIDAQPVRYYVHTAGEPPGRLVPADEVQLPARRIAVRSTLPEGDVDWIRDARPLRMLPALAAYPTPIGALAVALALVPAIVGLTGIARRWKPRRTRRSRRQALQQQRMALEDIRRLDVTDAAVRREVFIRLNSLVRDRLTDLDLPARNLTPDEIELWMSGRRKHVAAGDIVQMLRSCERAAYGGADELPGPEAAAAALGETERLLGRPHPTVR